MEVSWARPDTTIASAIKLSKKVAEYEFHRTCWTRHKTSKEHQTADKLWVPRGKKIKTSSGVVCQRGQDSIEQEKSKTITYPQRRGRRRHRTCAFSTSFITSVLTSSLAYPGETSGTTASPPLPWPGHSALTVMSQTSFGNIDCVGWAMLAGWTTTVFRSEFCLGSSLKHALAMVHASGGVTSSWAILAPSAPCAFRLLVWCCPGSLCLKADCSSSSSRPCFSWSWLMLPLRICKDLPSSRGSQAPHSILQS